ncbi:MAG: cupin domain-containing protein [Verrucomicrobia bacterium]|nr:MAG: cupin domain-containing protein [Verrucomicrobiota bacterium]
MQYQPSTHLLNSMPSRSARRNFLKTSAVWLALPFGGSIAVAEEIKAISQPKIVGPNDGTCVWAMGIHVKVRVTSDDTAGAYSTFEDVVPPGAGPPPHIHSREDENMFVLEGELEANLGGKIHTVGAGTFIHMPKGVSHSFKNKTNKPARMLLTYTPAGFEKWFFEIGTPTTADATDHPIQPTPGDIKRAVASAITYGVTFVKS